MRWLPMDEPAKLAIDDKEAALVETHIPEIAAGAGETTGHGG